MAIRRVDALLPYFSFKETSYSGTGAAMVVAPKNSRRHGLIFFSNTSTTCNLSTKPTVSSSYGIRLDSNNRTQRFTVQSDGGIVAEEWWGFCPSTLGEYIGVIELYYDPLISKESDVSGRPENI